MSWKLTGSTGEKILGEPMKMFVCAAVVRNGFLCNGTNKYKSLRRH